MSKTVQLYNWPFSQMCHECQSGYPVIPTDAEVGDQEALCMINHIQEYAGCSKFKEHDSESVEGETSE